MLINFTAIILAITGLAFVYGALFIAREAEGAAGYSIMAALSLIFMVTVINTNS